jgi:hypothetical protein
MPPRRIRHLLFASFALGSGCVVPDAPNDPDDSDEDPGPETSVAVTDNFVDDVSLTRVAVLRASAQRAMCAGS